MVKEEKQDPVQVAWEKLCRLLFYYEQIIQLELGELRQNADSKIHDCYSEDDNYELTTCQAKIDAAIRAVDELEKSCQEISNRWDILRQYYVVLPSHHQRQELTKEDLNYIDKRRKELANIEPEIGQIDLFFETGTEGVYWSFEVDGYEGYEGLRILNEGDRVVIYDSDGSIILDEVFVKDHQSGRESYRQQYPYGRGQQCCGNLWIHWLPKGWTANDWVEFFNQTCDKRAELYRLPDK